MPKKKRTEEEVITQAGVEVVLGGVAKEVKPLVIRESREWRKKLVTLMSQLPALANVTTETPEAFADVLQTVVITMSEEVIDLFFAYAKDLPRDKIEATATEAELEVAFQEVLTLAFPLGKAMPNALKRMTTPR